MMQRVHQQGFVLIVTLWVMVVLGTVLTSLAYQVRVESVVERWALNQSTLRWAARGTIHTAAARVLEHATDDYHSPQADWWSDEKLFRDQPIGTALVSLLRPRDSINSASSATAAGEVGANDDSNSSPQDTAYQFGLDDEESRLNINVAQPNQLTGFPGISTVLAESIVRFRQELKEQLQASSADADAASSENPVNATDVQPTEEANSQLVQGPIRSLRELLQIDGMTEELLFEKREDLPPLATLLTTISSGKVNVNSASSAVLTAVGLNEGQVNSVMAQRDETPFTSLEALQEIIGGDSDRWQRLSPFIDVRSTTFRLLAQARLPDKPRTYHTEATLYSGSSSLSFIRWQEY